MNALIRGSLRNPHAITVFAEAVKLATHTYNRQVFISTHSPVLLSQFAMDEILVFESGKERETEVVRLAEKTAIKELLDQYAVGSLYMAEEIARQSIAK